MSKWKCEICGKEFENFHAQGFDNKIHCPLCYFKRENKDLKQALIDIRKYIKKEAKDMSNNGCKIRLNEILQIIDKYYGDKDE